jgi:hypothetical protein
MEHENNPNFGYAARLWVIEQRARWLPLSLSFILKNSGKFHAKRFVALSCLIWIEGILWVRMLDSSSFGDETHRRKSWYLHSVTSQKKEPALERPARAL